LEIFDQDRRRLSVPILARIQEIYVGAQCPGVGQDPLGRGGRGAFVAPERGLEMVLPMDAAGR